MTQEGHPRSPNRAAGERGLNQERIVEAALQLLNEQGLKGLSMRKLAELLGVRAASLYWYVKSKSELYQWLADQICKEMEWPDHEDLPWRDKVRLGLESYRKTMLRYRDAVEIFANTPPLTPHRLQLIQSLYQFLLLAGMNREQATLALDLLNNYVIGFVMEEVRFTEMAGNQDSPESFRDQQNMIEKYPDLVSMMEQMMTIRMDERFQFGLQTILDGICFRFDLQSS